ncbi:hypothetical protein [Herbaspirillum chlorophenolicum]|uniref:hypothetical protein n=1 Tax=Herbaspirillum chlorophenolicum TaxID=211589 RepID=UPI00067C54FE|nr:hypothetical protein [Herbaspirillum chlorophenolicum]
MSGFEFSKIAIIQSLEEDEVETGTELKKYIDGLREDNLDVPEAVLINVKGSDEFLKVIEQLTVEAIKSEEVPILQIEMHGWQDKTGLAFADDSSLTWQEISTPFASLNRATGFNLLVCMSACFGGHSLSFVKPDGPSPCFGLIGPSHSVDSAELLGGFRAFYRELITSRDVNSALKHLHAHKLEEGEYLNIRAEDWYFQIADLYLRTKCTKERLRARADTVLAQMSREGNILSSGQIAKIVEIGTDLAKSYVERRFPTFFMLDSIPSNEDRFGQSLARAKEEVERFMASQK